MNIFIDRYSQTLQIQTADIIEFSIFFPFDKLTTGMLPPSLPQLLAASLPKSLVTSTKDIGNPPP